MNDRLKAALAGRYRLERELGQGGMATVYLAEDLKHHRRVAVKVLKPEVGRAVGAERFLREIETTANLRHPHMLPLFDSGGSGDFLYYVMPYVEGETLRQRLAREPRMPVVDALSIAGDVADALAHAHERGIVHRDIKPENILLEGGHAVVADFGIARAVDTVGSEQLTETGFSLGTPAYMSPEQVAGDPAPDARADQYALACVLFEMLAGQPLFSGASGGAVMRQHVVAPPPSISAHRPAVPTGVVAAVRKALAKDPADRFDDVGEFRDALRTPDPPVPVRVRWRRVGPMAAATGVLVIATIVTVALAGKSGSASAADEASVAVLPFADLSPDQADAYLGDGMAETLANALANVPRLSVAARNSAFLSKVRGESPSDIGRQLGVANVLAGSIQRAAGRLRVIARLVRTTDGRSVWSRNFDRGADSIFVLQDEVASAVAEALQGQMPGPSATAGTGTSDLRAYDAYLQGRFLWKKRSVPDLMQAISYFEEAIARDSSYARAWAGLADAWVTLPYYSDTIRTSDAIPRAIRAAQHALALDPDLAEAHTSLGYAEKANWNWEAAERELRNGIELDTGYATAHKWYSDLLASRGRHDEALAEAKRAAELDPRSPNARTIVGLREWELGRTREARADLERALAMDPTFPLALRHASNFFWAIGDTTRFFALRERLHAVSSHATIPVGALRAAMAAGGRDSVLRLQANAPGARWAPTERARWHAQLGDLDAAFADLDQAMAERNVWLALVLCDPELAPLRSDPRYAALLNRMGLD